MLAKDIRYILKMDAGALDHFTKIAENDIAIIEMVSGKAIDFELSPCFMIPPFLLFNLYFLYFLICEGKRQALCLMVPGFLSWGSLGYCTTMDFLLNLLVSLEERNRESLNRK
jgi:hypothetical protein